jgi:TetR/AcrR family transcriptional repressor of nem operon
MQAVLQGAFIFAKARQGPGVIVECIEHLRRYLQMLFHQPHPEETAPRTTSIAEPYELSPADL